MRKTIQDQYIYSKPTMCLHCHLVVEMVARARSRPSKGSMAVPSVWPSIPLPALEDPEAGSHRERLKPLNSARLARATRPRQRGSKMSKLFFANIPYNCSDRNCRNGWNRGYPKTRSIRIVRDLVAGFRPRFGYVELKDDSEIRKPSDAQRKTHAQSNDSREGSPGPERRREPGGGASVSLNATIQNRRHRFRWMA